MRDYVKRAIAVIVVGALGLGISLWTESIHRHVVADKGYVSICTVNEQVNCDIVLSSKWAELAGVSVSLLAVIYYAVVIGLAVGVTVISSSAQRRRLGDSLFLQAIGGLAFSLYMAVIAFVVLRTVCLMCSGLYVVAVLEFVACWRLRSSLALVGRRQAAARDGADRAVVVGGGVAIAAMVAVVGWKVMSPDTSRAIDPKFQDWFRTLPVVQVAAGGGNQRGAADAPVTIVEFSDFECGHCNNFHRSVDEIWNEQKQNVRVIFRHFPLDSDCNKAVPSRFHPSACFAAVAAECAGEQGRFWEYHELLFKNQQQLGREALLGYGDQVGLDRTRFTQCLQQPEARARVEEDARAGAALGITGTPTVIINGRMITGSLDTDDLRRALTLARGVTP